uniref:15-hydroxyprostaglandin dehydrogenase n=1 Tax=Oryzias latipes TaxID=8090 RepID=A0A3B3IML3_ORYLA
MSVMGRVALVTGGAQGIGRAVVEALLRSGAKVSVVDINQSCGDVCKSELDAEFGGDNCAFIQCDVTDGHALRDAFQKTVELFGRLDIVINNAGINNEKNWEKTIDVNLTSLIKGTYLGLEHMSREHGKRGGTIVNVSSMAAFLHSPHQPVYTATKHGVIGFTRAMAVRLASGPEVRGTPLCSTLTFLVNLPTLSHAALQEPGEVWWRSPLRGRGGGGRSAEPPTTGLSSFQLEVCFC